MRKPLSPEIGEESLELCAPEGKKPLEKRSRGGRGASKCRNHQNRGLLPSNIQRRKWLQFQYREPKQSWLKIQGHERQRCVDA